MERQDCLKTVFIFSWFVMLLLLGPFSLRCALIRRKYHYVHFLLSLRLSLLCCACIYLIRWFKFLLGDAHIFHHVLCTLHYIIQTSHYAVHTFLFLVLMSRDIYLYHTHFSLYSFRLRGVHFSLYADFSWMRAFHGWSTLFPGYFIYDFKNHVQRFSILEN